MKNYVRLALVTAALGSAAHAAPFLAIGDGAELFVTGTLGVRSDDNIFLADTVNFAGKPQGTESDTIFDINPGVDLTFGKGGNLKGSLTLVDAFANYTDHNELNTQLFSGDFKSKFDDGKLKLHFALGYHELNQNTVDNVGLTRRNETVASTGGEVEVSQITSVGGGVNFTHLKYRRTGYGDSDDLTVPLNFYYKWTPKVDLSFGYRYRNYETTVGADSNDHYFNIGARGEFTPKLTGEFTVGYNMRHLSNVVTLTGGQKIGKNQQEPGVEGRFNYAITPKTSLQLGASNDYGTSPQGLQQKNTSVNAGVSIEVDSQWSFNGGVSYRSIDYYTRTDNYTEASVGAGYILNTYVKFNAGYTYRNNDSDAKGNSFKGNVFSLAAIVRY